MNEITLVLDAMGVIYASADDVVELLVPFVREHGGHADLDEISDRYTLASLGEIDADTFWRDIGLSPALEQEYLRRHQLRDGLMDFMRDLPSSVASVWCLSNDVSRWSRSLRTSHNLDQFFAGFVISGDVGSRKPSPAIYQELLDRTRQHPHAHVFVDDRQKNLDAAETFGLRTVHFDPAPCENESTDGRFRAPSFSVLWDYLNSVS